MESPRENPPDAEGTTAVAAREPGGSAAQTDLLDRLRAGDMNAFAQLVDGWSPALIRVALLYVSTAASAEEVVQDTWLAVIRRLDGFEGRSSLRTWVFRILENVARDRGRREARALPWSSAFPEPRESGEHLPTVDQSRFRGPDDRWPGGWTVAGRPAAWQPPPEDAAVAAELRRELGDALAQLPDRQRTVVELRDVHGLTAEEVCERLLISPANQRVLLHRGRAHLRARLEHVYAHGRGAGDDRA